MNKERTCGVCGRHLPPLPLHSTGPVRASAGSRIVVHHSGYGCDSGCCGHEVALLDETGSCVATNFEFDHFSDARESREDFIMRMAAGFVREYGAPIDFEHSEANDDC